MLLTFELANVLLILSIDCVRFNVPPNTIIGHIGDGFTVQWPNQQCQSTERR